MQQNAKTIKIWNDHIIATSIRIQAAFSIMGENGLPRSAGAGVGMLTGTGDPLLDFLGFQGSSRFHHCKIRFYSEKTWEKPIGLDPRKIQKYSSKSQTRFKNMFDLIGLAYVLKFGILNFLFKFSDVQEIWIIHKLKIRCF